MTDAVVIREEISALRSEVQKGFQQLRTAINGDDLGTPGISTELRRHTKEDEKQFAAIRATIETSDRERVEIRLQIARWGGAISVLVFLVGLVATYAASK